MPLDYVGGWNYQSNFEEWIIDNNDNDDDDKKENYWFLQNTTTKHILSL